ncbi:MAG: transketolase, partial [Proteobacteria bacterium]|nr:transketolase [Pseudomonadota bacterium]
GKVIPLREGRDVCMLAAGTIVPVALQTAEMLAQSGIAATVVSCHTIKPLDDEFLSSAFRAFPVIATVEEHSLIGGLGGALAEWAAERGPLAAKILRFGTRDEFIHEGGGQEHARHFFGLFPENIAEQIRQTLSKG